MSSAITNAGENLIALHQNQETGLIVDKFILANVAGVDPAAAVNRTEGLPDAGDIVYEYTIPTENKGYINPNQVVYSMLLTSDIGDFDFNWIGLYSTADDAVIAITYCPTLSKWKTAHPTMGNALTRNFMLEYSGIQATTNITVEASTWQIDFTARLKGIDERERLSNLDIYGGACFFGDGYLVINDAGTFKVQPGTAYVEGVRIALAATQIIAPTLPAKIFLDVALQTQGSDRVAVASIVFADPGDYVDGTNDRHYGQKLAEIDAGGMVTDFRPTTLDGFMGEIVATKDHTHETEDVTDLLNARHSYTAAQGYEQKPLAITDHAATWNCLSVPSAILHLDDDVTTLTIVEYSPGEAYDLTVVQGSSGGKTCTMPSSLRWANGKGYEPETDAGTIDRIYLAPFTDSSDGTVKVLATAEYGYTEAE